MAQVAFKKGPLTICLPQFQKVLFTSHRMSGQFIWMWILPPVFALETFRSLLLW